MKVDSSDNSSYFVEAFIDKKGNAVIPFQKHIDYGNFEKGIAQGRRFIYTDGNRYSGYYELFYINRKGKKIWSEIVKQ
jgi:hypothetical protein